MRETIERVFGAPVFNRYGSREVGDIACECEGHQGLHVSAPWQYLEVLRPDGTACLPEEEGELVITNLTNYAMPLIRYRIGDTGSWASHACTCGRAWPLLQQVSGRVCDTFVTPEGVNIPGEYFAHMLRTQAWLRRFQIVQESADGIDVYLQPLEEVSEGDVAQAESVRLMFQQAVGPTCTVRMHFVREIQPSASGKYLYTISKVGNLEQARK
jgi:phenylacetate-CoA ligase